MKRKYIQHETGKYVIRASKSRRARWPELVADM
jgi:hypothetical protein